jgi:uncharacterized membrane protein YccC
VLTDALPLAVAAAVYAVGFAAVVALLSGPDPMRRAVAFLLGSLVVSVAGFAVVIAVLSSSRRSM